MSEKLHKNNEAAKNPEVDKEAVERSKQNLEKLKQLAEKEKNVSESDVERLREEIEKTAASKEKSELESNAENKKNLPDFNQGDLKRKSFDKTMKQVQSQLPTFERAFSKVIHQKSVEKLSNFGGKTVARPSGVLGGGLVTFIGSLIVLYYAKHYGFEYNYSIFIILFGGGFVVGLAIELLGRLASRKK